MATLKDVALLANVHPTTASSVLSQTSGNSRFSAETKRRVEEAARKLGYVRNLTARNLRVRKSMAVGIVAGNLKNPFFAELATHVEELLKQKGYQLLLTCQGAESSGEEIVRLVKTLAERGVDGLLVWSELWGGRRVEFPETQEIPTVFLGYGPPKSPAVSLDIAGGLERAVNYHVARGCEQLVFFAPVMSRNAGFPKPRSEIIVEVCRKLGKPVPKIIFHEGESWNLAAAFHGAREAVSQVPRDAGIIGYNDVCAAGWFLAAREKELRPRLVGFDGTSLIRSLAIDLPYVDLRSEVIGQQAVDLLMKLIAGGSPEQTRLSVEPVFRGGV